MADDDNIVALKRAVKFDAADGAAWRNLGAAYGSRGDWDDSIAAFKRAVEVDATDGMAWRNLGVAYFRKGDWDDGIAAFKRAVEVVATDGAAWRNLGVAYGNRGDWDDSIAAFKRAVAIDATDGMVWRCLGGAHLTRGDWDDSIAAFKRAVAIDATDGAAWRNLGVAYDNRGDWDDSIAAFKRALEIDATDGMVWRSLGGVHLKRGDWDDGIAASKRTLKIDATDGVAWQNLSVAYFSKGDWDDSIAACKSAIANGDTSGLAAVRLSNAFWRKGNLDGLKRYFLHAYRDTMDALPLRYPIFVQVPKTGGVSTISSLDGNGVSIQHRGLTDAFEEFAFSPYYSIHRPSFLPTHIFEGKEIFSNVRNVWGFLVSYFEWARRGRFPNAWDIKIAERGFDYFARSIADREDIWPSRHLLFFQIFEQPSGRLVADWVNRTERLNDDMKALAASSGRQITPVPVLNRSGTMDHCSYYTTDLKELVEKTWSDDIRLFGFDFENGYNGDALVHRDTSEIKGKMSYSLTDRILKYEGSTSRHPR